MLTSSLGYPFMSWISSMDPMSTGLVQTAASTINGNNTNHNNNNAPTAPERTSKTNLYIKGLPTDFNDQRLEALVPDKQLVKSVKAASDDGSTCKGYGFIDFLTEDAALAAQKFIQEQNNGFTVKFAKENEKDATNLYITNLPPSWKGKKDEERLKEEFEKFGPIQSVHIQTDPCTNRSAGVGFVRFTNEEGAKKALESLREQPKFLDGSSLPLQAKYADKHNPVARARRSSQLPSGGKMLRMNSVSPRDCLLQSNGLSNALSPYHNLIMRPSYPFSYANVNAPTNGNPLANLTTTNTLSPYAFGGGMSPGGTIHSTNAAATGNIFTNGTGNLNSANLAHPLLAQLPAVNSSVTNSNQLTFIQNDLMTHGALHYIPLDFSQLLSYYSPGVAESQQ